MDFKQSEGYALLFRILKFLETHALNESLKEPSSSQQDKSASAFSYCIQFLQLLYELLFVGTRELKPEGDVPMEQLLSPANAPNYDILLGLVGAAPQPSTTSKQSSTK